MPRKPLFGETARPRTIIRGVVSAKLAMGPVCPAALADELWATHRDEWADWTRDLCVNSLSKMIRDVCKEAVEREEDSLFPGSPDHLPRAISTSDSSGRRYYLALRRSSVGELRQTIEMLGQQIAADTKRRNSLRALLMECEERGARDRDLVVDVLARALA